MSVGQARVFNQQPPFSADRHLSNWIVVHCKLYIVKAHYTSTYRVSSIRQNFCPSRGDSRLSRFNICLLLLKAKVKYKTINIEAKSSPVFLHLKAPRQCLSTSFPSLLSIGFLWLIIPVAIRVTFQCSQHLPGM